MILVRRKICQNLKIKIKSYHQKFFIELFLIFKELKKGEFNTSKIGEIFKSLHY